MAEKNPAAEGEAGGREERAEALRMEDRDRVLGLIATRELFIRTLEVRRSDTVRVHGARRQVRLPRTRPNR